MKVEKIKNNENSTDSKSNGLGRYLHKNKVENSKNERPNSKLDSNQSSTFKGQMIKSIKDS